MGPRNAYKDMLDNVVSSITCVSMNHQNQLEQMANGAMFTTQLSPMSRRRRLEGGGQYPPRLLELSSQREPVLRLRHLRRLELLISPAYLAPRL
jgi:hypothetical protein